MHKYKTINGVRVKVKSWGSKRKASGKSKKKPIKRTGVRNGKKKTKQR